MKGLQGTVARAVRPAGSQSDLGNSLFKDCKSYGTYQWALLLALYTGARSSSEIAREMHAMGCHEISLGDTTGKGTPETIAAMLDEVLQYLPASQLAGHYHDTDGRAIENIAVSLERGLRIFDASVGGLGGCPYAPGAKGNVDTLMVDDALRASEYRTGLSRSSLVRAAAYAGKLRASA